MNSKSQRGVLRSLLLLFGALLALVAIALVVVSLFRIPIDLAPYKPMVESAAGKALGRMVKVDGDIKVTTSLWPYFEIQSLRIANPPGFGEGDLASMELARVTVGLLPLLKRRIRIREFRVAGLTLDLQRTAEGETNWVLQPPGDAEQEDSETGTGDEDVRTLASDALSVDELLLEDILVRFQDDDKEALEFNLASAEGSAARGEPMDLNMAGEFLEEAFTLDLKASSLAGFLAMTRAKLGIQLNIAGIQLRFAGLSEALRGNRSTELQLEAQGADLSSLDDLLNLDLPPLKDYKLSADLRAVPGKIELSSLQASVKDSKLFGSMVIDRRGKHPVATMDLRADSIQLEDFDTGDWTADTNAAVDPEEAAQDSADHDQASQHETRRDKIMSEEALRRADLKLTVRVEEVLSGKDHLGSGDLSLNLSNGRIALDPLHLELPKASLLVKASLKPGRTASEASLRVLIENFDFGVLSRLSDPNSKVGGTLNVDLDVKSHASNTNIMGGANGYFDISAQPEDLHSGIVDLWALNLLSSVVTSASKEDKASEVNCVISRFRLENGVMTAEQLTADTSKIRICGSGQVSFADEDFRLEVVPKAKRPEFFSLATPLAVRGEFDDFRIGMKAGVLTLGTTAVNFVISPITTPFKRLFRDDLPEDGADICALQIGPRTQKLEPLPGC